MTEQTIVAVLAAVGLIGASAVTGVGVILSLLWKRIARLETREREMWWWARIIADMYYKYCKEGSPNLPPPPKYEEEKSS